MEDDSITRSEKTADRIIESLKEFNKILDKQLIERIEWEKRVHEFIIRMMPYLKHIQ